jgi:hypothetical protein
MHCIDPSWNRRGVQPRYIVSDESGHFFDEASIQLDFFSISPAA